MKKLLVTLTTLFLVAGMVLFNACEEVLNQLNTKPAESSLKVINTFSNIILKVDKGMKADSTKNGMRLMADDYTETIIGNFPNRTLIWDFGLGSEFQGIIKILQSDEYAQPGAIMEISFDQLTYKGRPVEGSIRFENLGQNDEGMDEYLFTLNQAQVDVSLLTSDWKLQRTSGTDTPEQEDDIFTIFQNGSEPATGITEEGEEFTLTIIEGIVIDLTCEHKIVKGIFNLISGGVTVTANFGEGECDNEMKVDNGILKVDLTF